MKTQDAVRDKNSSFCVELFWLLVCILYFVALWTKLKFKWCRILRTAVYKKGLKAKNVKHLMGWIQKYRLKWRITCPRTYRTKLRRLANHGPFIENY